MADMTVCMVADIWERRGLVHNWQLHTVTEELLEKKDVSMITDGYYSGYTTLYNT